MQVKSSCMREICLWLCSFYMFSMQIHCAYFVLLSFRLRIVANLTDTNAFPSAGECVIFNRMHETNAKEIERGKSFSKESHRNRIQWLSKSCSYYMNTVNIYTAGGVSISALLSISRRLTLFISS